MQKSYIHSVIESDVQHFWEINSTFKVNEDNKKIKFYCLSMMPYPSGKLHMGHVRNYTIGDVIARYQRMLGKNVLHPIGWDAFGLPAENAAIKNKLSPYQWTLNNIKYMKKQLKSLGFSYDWSREISTCDPEYYRWEQWLFINLYKKNLVYKKISEVNWCEQDKTVLANEQVIKHRCWRCYSKIKKKKISQWFMRITNYSSELLDDLSKLDQWPEQVKIMQKNWIGKSEGIDITFYILNIKTTITIFFEKISIFMSASFIIISYKHKLLSNLHNENIKLFIKKCICTQQKLELKICNLHREGIYSGLHVIHPLNNKILPIWIVNFITEENNINSAIGIPGYDVNDYNFAKKYSLPIRYVLSVNNINVNKFINFSEISNKFKNKTITLCNSNKFNGLSLKKSHDIILQKLLSSNIAKKRTRFKMRDWNISRQRYWGAPIPMLKLQDNTIIPVNLNDLPVTLPNDINLNKNIVSSLKTNKNWFKIIYNQQIAIRDTDTFDTFVESSWYYARFTSSKYKHGMIESKAANYWLPIDQYVGGIEHAIMHLLYFRFYHKILRDIGLVKYDEPAKRLLCQGMVLSDTFYYISKTKKIVWVNPTLVTVKRDKKGSILNATDIKGNNLIYAGMSKMSKSKNNGIDPQLIIKKYGSDTVRLFIMFAAPVTLSLQWTEKGVKGAYRFLKKIWKLTYEHVKLGFPKPLNPNNLNLKQQELFCKVNKTIVKVTDDIDRRQSFNTAIASIMQLTNSLIKFKKISEIDRSLLHESLTILIRMLYPFTPHICFILWNELVNKKNIDYFPWPIPNEKFLKINKSLILIQINGKLRSKIFIKNNIDENTIKTIILKEKKILKYIKNNKIKNIIYIPNKVSKFYYLIKIINFNLYIN
ncbi:MAG: leucine--tRNA ligase [Enterobacterales bacterium]